MAVPRSPTHKEKLVSTSSVPCRATPTTTRQSRGLALFRDRGDEIKHVRGRVWSVPSCSGEGRYLADVAGACTCADRPPAEEVCKHIIAALLARAKSGECELCGVKVRRRELVEVPDDHPTLGGLVDELCSGCGRSQGIC